MPFLPIEDFQLYYEVHGSGPAVVFLHGAGGNHLSWWQQVPYFSRSYTCVTLDHRAFGLSVDPHDGPGRRAFATDLTALLEHLEVRELAIVGHSMGGRTVAGFLLRTKPGSTRVWAAVLSGTHGGVVNDESRGLQRDLSEKHKGRSLRERALAPRFMTANPELTFLYNEINRLNRARPDDFLAPIPGYIGTTREAFAELGIPTLFMTGSDDEVMSPEVVKIAASELPGAELAVIEGAGHSSYFEKPDDFNAALGRFLDRHRPS